MYKIGGKYICGGREFWCVGIAEKEKHVVIRSGLVSIVVPMDKFEGGFKCVGEITARATYTAKFSDGGVVAGKPYTVESFEGNFVVLAGVGAIDIAKFATLF